MSVVVPIQLSIKQAHDAAIHDVNRWRGHCIESYARIEQALGEALCSVAKIKEQPKSPPEMFGPRLKALRALVGPEGEYPNPILFKHLENCDHDLQRRNLIVHATGRIWIDANGGWLWAYRFDPTGKGREEVMHLEKGDAEAIERRLASCAQSLCSRLRNFRRDL